MKEKMKFIVVILKLIGWVVKTAVILAICSSILFVAYKGNQPMQVPEAPEGMTYFEFVADRIDAAKMVEPSRCGWGMMLSLAALGPIYSFVYTEVGIHPDGALARGTAPDPDIPKDVLITFSWIISRAFVFYWISNLTFKTTYLRESQSLRAQ